MREGSSPSWFNPQEAVLVMKYLQSVVNNGFYTLTFDDVGIITPYRKQVNFILLVNMVVIDFYTHALLVIFVINKSRF